MFKKLSFIILALLFSSQAHSMIVNGSLTGTVGNNSVPAGWTNNLTGVPLGSPDTNDVNNNVGGGTPFIVQPIGPSPDGGTWVGMANNLTGNNLFREEFGQDVGGLTAGTNYLLSWYEGNFGAATGPTYDQPSAIDVLLDGTSIGTGALMSVGRSWLSASLMFMATSNTHNLSFSLTGSGPAYLSIDGISLSEVPVPAAVWLFGTALVGLFGFKRRKSV